MKSFIEFQKEEAELEEEQLDELSKKTLGAYTKQAAVGLALSGIGIGRSDNTAPHAKTMTKRIAGINRATDKLTKEEAELDEEQLDELSKDTLASYEKKSRVAAHKHALASELKGLDADPAGSYAHKQMADKRHAGWKVAVKKLHTEESDLDETKNPFKNLPGKFTHILNKDVRSDHGIINIGTTLRHTGGDRYEVRAGKAKGKTVEIHKDHVNANVNVNEESDTPFEGPYKQSKGTVTDKSGAKHTPLSNVRSLARNAIEKMKQKMRMAHLSPEVRAEKLARNEELVGGQKKLDIDKDGKIEKSDLEVLRAKKLKEDVTTAAQKLKAALDRHTEHAVAANRAGDHEAVKVHQEYANKIKTKLGKLAKNEEVDMDEELEESIASHTRSQLMQKIKSGDWEAMSDIVPGQHVQIRHTGTNKRRMVHVKDSREDSTLGVKEESDQLPSRKHSSFIHGGKKERLQSMQDKRDVIAHIDQIAQKLKAKKEKEERGEGSEIKEAEMTDAETAKREKIVKGMKKSFKDFTAKYGDRAKEVMYATATKKAMEEEVEEELEEDIDEGATTRNGAITVHKGTYGTSYQPNDDEDDEDTPEKKEPAVKRGRGRPAGADSGANTKGSKKAKTYGGVAVHSLRLPNNNK